MKNKRIICFLLFWVVLLAHLDICSTADESPEPLPLKPEGPGLLFSLEECIRFALGNSFEVKLARLDFLIAETGQSAAEAIYDTMLSAEISYEKDKRAGLSVFSPGLKRTNIYSAEAAKTLPSGTELTLSFSDTRDWSDSGYVSQNPAHTAEATLEARQPIGKNIFGYVDRRNISVTSLAIQNADLDTKERIERLLADVEAAYREWAFYKKGLQIYQDILKKAKSLHQANARNYDTGLIERADFLASQANILIREKDVLIAENNYRRAEEKIKLLMNINAAAQLHPQEALEYRGIEVNLEDCLSQAFQKRRDYHKSKRELEIKDIVLQTKANERWPEIDLVASLTANGIDSRFGPAANNITTDDNTDYYAGMEFSMPLENNLARSEFEKATHKKEKAILTLKNIERIIITEIGDAFGDYVTYAANVSKLQEAMQLQQEKLKEEEKRFRSGRSSTKRLIDYQQDYLNAQLEFARGILDVTLARVNLEKALNIILERYEALL